jgi:hypothetical protein
MLGLERCAEMDAVLPGSVMRGLGLALLLRAPRGTGPGPQRKAGPLQLLQPIGERAQLSSRRAMLALVSSPPCGRLKRLPFGDARLPFSWPADTWKLSCSLRGRALSLRALAYLAELPFLGFNLCSPIPCGEHALCFFPLTGRSKPGLRFHGVCFPMRFAGQAYGERAGRVSRKCPWGRACRRAGLPARAGVLARWGRGIYMALLIGRAPGLSAWPEGAGGGFPGRGNPSWGGTRGLRLEGWTAGAGGHLGC